LDESWVFFDMPVRSRRLAETAKRMLDVLITLCAAPLVLPLIGLLAVLVKLQDGGPCFYRRRVVGLQGEFDAFKLRTMRVDADRLLEESPELKKSYEQGCYKIVDDPRITPLGKWLRRFSADELPQFLNVLSGEMSLVGPRMITREELVFYGAARDLILSVKPGITGYWQVYGRHTLSYDEKVRMDFHYIQHRSLVMDVVLLLRTAPKVLFKKEKF
jgi:lipopolysaccharide/colanic/teichoic acid biosynthesis glycosyltransferase